jgi:DNA-binding PadR family transcriptional regulator
LDSSKNKTLEMLKRKSVKALMDIIILTELNNSKMSGYDFIGFIHENFGLLISSGTVYAHMYSLERKELITSEYEVKKRVYSITEKGKEIFELALKTNKELLSKLDDVLII